MLNIHEVSRTGECNINRNIGNLTQAPQWSSGYRRVNTFLLHDKHINRMFRGIEKKLNEIEMSYRNEAAKIRKLGNVKVVSPIDSQCQ